MPSSVSRLHGALPTLVAISSGLQRITTNLGFWVFHILWRAFDCEVWGLDAVDGKASLHGTWVTFAAVVIAAAIGVGGAMVGSVIALSGQTNALEAAQRQHEQDVRRDAIVRTIASFQSYRDAIVLRELSRWGSPKPKVGEVGSEASLTTTYNAMRAAEGALVVLGSEKTVEAMWKVDQHMQEWAHDVDIATGAELATFARDLESLLGEFYNRARDDLQGPSNTRLPD